MDEKCTYLVLNELQTTGFRQSLNFHFFTTIYRSSIPVIFNPKES